MSEKKPALFARAEEVLGLFKRGAEFTRELLAENERLRSRVAAFEEQQLAASDEIAWEKLPSELLTRIQSLEGEKDDALERLHQMQEENEHFAGRFLEVEEENNYLANLYVASFQLHSTLDLSEVLQIIVEIVINLIGGEVFAIYVLDERSGRLSAVASEGRGVADFQDFALGQGALGEAVATGRIVCAEEEGPREGSGPLVCIPLRIQERAMGAIAIHKLLQQKGAFTPLDHELFTLLAGHAATAIFAARLYSQSERKLNTIQGFIDLLTK
jgi:hypothetical protein